LQQWSYHVIDAEEGDVRREKYSNGGASFIPRRILEIIFTALVAAMLSTVGAWLGLVDRISKIEERQRTMIETNAYQYQSLGELSERISRLREQVAAIRAEQESLSRQFQGQRWQSSGQRDR
jgi:hypothetical protein